MKKFSTALSALMLVGVMADAAEVQPAVLDVFGCSLHEGKTMEDLQGAIDYFNVQREKIDSAALATYRAYSLTPYRAITPYDLVWIGRWDDAMTMARGNMDYDATPEGQAADARFFGVADCDSGVVLSDQIYGPVPRPDTGGDVVVDSYACHLKEGRDMEDSDDSIEYWRSQVDKMDRTSVGNFTALRWKPIISSSGFDVYYLGVHDDLEAWARFGTAYRASDAGQDAEERFDSVHACESNLWIGRQISGPPIE